MALNEQSTPKLKTCKFRCDSNISLMSARPWSYSVNEFIHYIDPNLSKLSALLFPPAEQYRLSLTSPNKITTGYAVNGA